MHKIHPEILVFVCVFCLVQCEAGYCLEEPLPSFDALPSHPDLPDALTMFDGTPVKTPEQWFQERRPELKVLFQHYMYGYMPAPPKIETKITKTDPTVFGGKATLKEIEIQFSELPENAPRIHLALIVPNQKKAPVPVFLGLNDLGNQVIIDHPGITFDTSVELSDPQKQANMNARGSQTDFWCVENSIDRGFAFATFYQGNIDPDKDDFTDGIHPFYPNLPGPKETHWGTIAAWAWGLQRGVDYLVTDPDIDKSKICLIGHSRRGKTALLATAFDERVALVVPQQSGTGGCALSRNNDQETVERINRVFPHWFNDIFPQFNGHEEKLPIDQNLLIALVAPRALMDGAGLQDTWANFESALRAIKAANNVYKFLGCQGLVGKGVIQQDEPITADNVGEILQYRRDTKHTLNIGYWNQILHFADIYFQKRDAKK